MKLNADRSRRAFVDSRRLDWIASPVAGVWRRMLERDGDEVARATSVVRYDGGSQFDAHVHDLGEEFLVLRGLFADEHGRYPVGTYVRNPWGSSHAPSAPDAEGCTIFVKLRQLPEHDERLVIDVEDAELLADNSGGGVEVRKLYEGPSEHVAVERWEEGVSVVRDAPAGLELFVLEGALEQRGGDAHAPDSQPRRCEPGCWSRIPAGDRLMARALSPCRFYIKTYR